MSRQQAGRREDNVPGPERPRRLFPVTAGLVYVMVLLRVGYGTGGVAPYFFGISQHTKAVDPVVQASALTDIVVEAAVAALLLPFAIQAHKKFGTLDPHDLAEFKS